MVSTGTPPTIQEMKESWSGGLFFTNYLLLKKGTSVAAFEAKLNQLGIAQSEKDNKLNFSLQSLNDIYFGSDKIVDNNRGDKGNQSMLFILASVGLLILVVACINYLNLTSAQALTQTKALAVRKVCGAPRFDLIRQMVAGIGTGVAGCLAFCIAGWAFRVAVHQSVARKIHTHSPLPTNFWSVCLS